MDTISLHKILQVIVWLRVYLLLVILKTDKLNLEIIFLPLAKLLLPPKIYLIQHAQQPQLIKIILFMQDIFLILILELANTEILISIN